MKTQATARYIRVPASKARLVLEHIRGKSVGEALTTLQFAEKAAARLIATSTTSGWSRRSPTGARR